MNIALLLQWLAIAANAALWSRMLYDVGVGSFEWLLVGRVLGLLIAAGLCVKIGHGANWARIVLLLLFLWDLGTGSHSYKLIMIVSGTFEKACMLTQYGSVLVALILVFGPGRAWFRRR